jgi:tRNA(Ile)-lysidine synthase
VSTASRPVGEEEADALFSGLENLPGLVLAVSGGPDSTALLLLAARWADRLKSRRRAPKLVAVTVDHGLRPEAAREAAAVKRLARELGVTHRTLRWQGRKPKAGLQEAARYARYRLLAQAAARSGYSHVLTAHTLDDQAETVLFRLARGSGLLGLAGMARVSLLPGGSSLGGRGAATLVRPFLHIPKARLVATLKAARLPFSDDPTNRDPRFTRPRLRRVMPTLADEGLDARGLARFAARMRRAEATIEFAVDAAVDALAPAPWAEREAVVFETGQFAALPTEVALRLLGRAVAHAGDEGPVELGKLETLYGELRLARSRLRRTLAGALVTLTNEHLTVERAPARHAAALRKGGKGRFTK